MLKKLSLALVLLSNVAFAQTIPKPGEVYESLTYDLNGDGKKETIELVAYNVAGESESFYGQLRVTDSAGKVVWSAPKATEDGQPFSFGMFPYGASGLEWLGDIDGDGKAELLSPKPVSDLRPPTYRRYRWKGNAFQALSPKMLLESPAGSGKFAWRDPIEWDGISPITWVASISGAPQKLAEITAYRKDGAIWGGQAQMNGNGLGLTVTTWTKKLGPATN